MTAGNADWPDRLCAIEGCDKHVTSRGWCNIHYRRWLRHGDPTYVVPMEERRGPAVDPLSDDDYAALAASVEADARKLLPIVHAFVFKNLLSPEPEAQAS